MNKDLIILVDCTYYLILDNTSDGNCLKFKTYYSENRINNSIEEGKVQVRVKYYIEE